MGTQIGGSPGGAQGASFTTECPALEMLEALCNLRLLLRGTNSTCPDPSWWVSCDVL